MNQKLFINVLLYSLLGFVLSAIGIDIIQNPVSFLTILTVVLLIDANGRRA